MPNSYKLLLVLLIFAACNHEKKDDLKQVVPPPTDSLTEFSNIYSTPVKKTMYSTFVKDTSQSFNPSLRIIIKTRPKNTRLLSYWMPMLFLNHCWALQNSSLVSAPWRNQL